MIASTVFGFRLLVCYDCMQRFNYCKIQMPSTIPQLYAAMLDREKHIIAFYRNQFAKIRKEMRVRYKVVENYIIIIYI